MQCHFAACPTRVLLLVSAFLGQTFAFASATERSRLLWAWLLDSGANIAVVPEGDPAIVRMLPDEDPVSLRTSGGAALGKVCFIKTPIGNMRGLCVPSSPRIIPMWKVREEGFFHWDKGKKPKAGFRGRLLPLFCVDGLPFVQDEALQEGPATGAQVSMVRPSRVLT